MPNNQYGTNTGWEFTIDEEDCEHNYNIFIGATQLRCSICEKTIFEHMLETKSK